MSVGTRRTIPPLAASVVFLASVQSIWTGWPGENTALRWTLLLVVAAVAVKAALFAWMWRRMRP